MSSLFVTLTGARATWLVLSYDPPRRPARVAPPSLRPAPLGTKDLARLVSLFDQLEGR